MWSCAVMEYSTGSIQVRERDRLKNVSAEVRWDVSPEVQYATPGRHRWYYNAEREDVEERRLTKTSNRRSGPAA